MSVLKNLEDREAQLIKLINARNEVSKIIEDRKLGIYNLNEQLEEQYKPITKKLGEIEFTKIENNYYNQIESKIGVLDLPEIEATKKVTNAKTLNPKFGKKFIKNIEYNTITIKYTEFILFSRDNVGYLIKSNFDKKYEYEFTDELINLIYGYGSNDEKEIKNYLEILETSDTNPAAHYTLELKKQISKKDNLDKVIDDVIKEEKTEKLKKEGKGIKYLPDSPFILFSELRKLLAAKKAGNNNVFNETNAILKRLMEMNYINTDKYKRILNKYFHSKEKVGNGFVFVD